MLTEEQRIKKAHIALMKHPETALYSGVMMMGKTEVIDDAVTRTTFSLRENMVHLTSACGSLAPTS